MAGAVKTAVSITKKYTQPSTGIWETIRRTLAVDPERSNGVPLKAYRNPPPGSVDPHAYDEPVTLPAGDIADNPYWKRDVRRTYPRLSTVTQADAVALLTVGSAAKPSPQLAAGDDGARQLVAAREEGRAKGLAVAFDSASKIAQVLEEQTGLPPQPVSSSGHTKATGVHARRYELDQDQSYQNEYPCRTFV